MPVTKPFNLHPHAAQVRLEHLLHTFGAGKTPDAAQLFLRQHVYNASQPASPSRRMLRLALRLRLSPPPHAGQTSELYCCSSSPSLCVGTSQPADSSSSCEPHIAV